MNIETAQQYLGKKCQVSFTDSYGEYISLDLKVKSVTSAPLYGSFIIGDSYNVNLDLITTIYSY